VLWSIVPQSHTPTLPLYRATGTVFLFFPHIVRILRHRMSPYSYDRATIGLLDIRDMLYSLKPRGVCTTWPCCSAIPGVSVGQTNGRSALYLARAGTASRSARVRRLRRAHGTSILQERRSQRALSSTSAQAGSRSPFIHSPKSLRP